MNLNLIIVTAVILSLIVLVIYCIRSCSVKEGNVPKPKYSRKLKKLRRKEKELRNFCMRKYNKIQADRDTITRSADDNVQDVQYDKELKRDRVKRLRARLRKFDFPSIKKLWINEYMISL